jgi:hypothetical protein
LKREVADASSFRPWQNPRGAAQDAAHTTPPREAIACAKATPSPRIDTAVTIQQLRLDTLDSKQNRTMAEDITPAEKLRRFDVALDTLQRTVEAGGVVPDETLEDFLEAAQAYRTEPDYRKLLGSADR